MLKQYNRLIMIWFLGETGDMHNITNTIRDYIPELLARAIRPYAHQNNISSTRAHGISHPGNSLEIPGISINIARHHNYNLIISTALLLRQITGSQRNGRKRVPALRLHHDIMALTKLIDDAVALDSIGGERYRRWKSGLTYLPHNPLNHRLKTSIRGLEKTQELLAAHIIAQRPQAFARPAGK